MTRRPLTALAHEILAARLHPGDLAVDATVGNGHDTLFLARRVLPGGAVYGFDVQTAALRAARERLAAAGIGNGVTLCQQGHENLGDRLPAHWHGRVAAVTFNLGYLPGGDRSLITRPATTLAALSQGLAVLRPHGLLSLLVYRGHSGADDEYRAVGDWVARLGGTARVAHYDSPGPLLYVVEKTG